MPNTIKLHRIICCPLEKVYKAFLDADALARWLPPNGFTARVYDMNAEIGGTFKMSFTNFTTGSSHFWSREILELSPHKQIRYLDRFDDPNLPGDITVTVSLNAVSVGTELNIVQAGVPDEIPQEACYQGWQQSLLHLEKLVEPDIPDG